MASKDGTWSIELNNFSNGFAPLAFADSLTELGNGGHATVMQNVDILDGDLTQGPGLVNLTGTVNELIQFIMDKAVTTNTTYAIGTANLFRVTSTTVTGIHSITSCVEGESIQLLKGNLYYFYNTASSGFIGQYNFSTFNDSWGTGLQVAPHPSDKKEDIMVFGNGRYAGVYIEETGDLTVDKLDFGNDCQVDDVLYNAGFWYLAVNSGVTGTNRTEGQIYLYDGAALINTLTDETGVGFQRIGFLYRINGIVYVAYQDTSSLGFIIGYINGKSISPLKRFTGTLPNFQQKTLYKNTILFLSSGLVYSAGAMVGELPFQLSQIADGGYSTVGAIACPFGTPMISSSDGAGNFKLAQFSGYDTACNWKSIVFPVGLGKFKGYIDEIIVLTKTLGANASCALTIESDQATATTSAKTITTTGKRRHYFNNFGINGIEDFRLAFDWSGGSVTNPVPIRSVKINGHFVEST
jgi:hypothetical protein